MPSPTRIFIIGFMGSGKTHWARIWAEKYGLNYYDLDNLVEENEGLKINDIFLHQGEPYFRLAEAKALRTFAFQKNFILACGGGTPCFHDNMHWMNEHGITIYLKTSAEVIAQRLLSEASHRPLIKDLDPDSIFEFADQKIRERESYYLRATLVLTYDTVNENSLSSLGI